jgi:hypothetical protein
MLLYWLPFSEVLLGTFFKKVDCGGDKNTKET